MGSEVSRIIELLHREHGEYHLYFLGQDPRQSLESVEPFEILLDDSARGWLNREFVGLLSILEDVDFLPIQEIDEAAQGVVRYIPTQEIPLLDSWLGRIRQGVPDGADFDDLKAKAVIMRVRLHGTDDDIALIKVLNDTYTLRGKAVLRFIPTGVFTLSEEPSLVLDGSWDGLVVNANLELLREDRILTLFKYYEKFREAADEFITNLASHDAFGDMDYLSAVVSGRVSLQRKLYKAAQGDVDRIDFKRLKNFIDTGRIALTIKDGKIECSTVEEAKVLVDVLMDNFVKSMLTDEEYKAYNKAVLKK